MTNERIVSLGFLTQANLDRLGTTFTLHVPIPHDDIFAELIERLDEVEATPLGPGITIMPTKIP